jgi:alpha-glucosidase
MDELISAAHKRGIRIIMDLVINHTSDEHPWFIESRDNKNSPKRDWYIWRDGCEPTAEKPTCDPNNWKVFFMAVHGNMIKKLHSTTCTYFQKQPDLNWKILKLNKHYLK